MIEKGGIGELIFFLIILAGLIVLNYWFWAGDIKEYTAYKDFCEDRTNFCYCSSWNGCEFKTSWSSINGLSEDTKALCELATKLNDKKILFKVGCDGE